jgi:tRNA(His) 5'-end guanylyltransferase
MEKDSIGNRMKANYENRYRLFLTRRTPVIMRFDGRAFHTLTRGLQKPFDYYFSDTMVSTASFLCSEIQGAKCAYVQSDEISVLITDFDTLTTDAWFDYNIQKMTSISAGLASAYFTTTWCNDVKITTFDSRVFNIPTEEVCNYFIWRQIDWVRNSVQMLAQSQFSHSQLHKKNTPMMHDMLHEKGINWADLEERWKNGMFVFRGDNGGWNSAPASIFKECRCVIEQYLK